MTELSRRLDRVIKKTLKNTIIPIQTEEGILVGDVLIVNEHTVKHIYRNNNLLYKNIHLNVSAVAIANMLALKHLHHKIDELYNADQEYGKWYIDSQLFRTKHQKCMENHDYDRADMFWARYCESRNKAVTAKKRVECLSVF